MITSRMFADDSMTGTYDQRRPVSIEDYQLSRWLEKSAEGGFCPQQLKAEDKASLTSVGVDIDNCEDAGGILIYDHNAFTVSPRISGIEILPMETALARYPEVFRDYFFKAVDRDLDRYTKTIAGAEPHGFFIRVRKHTRIQMPVPAGFFMPEEKSAMGVHNIVVLEQGARLHLVTGCTAGCRIKAGLHAAVSEYYVAENASLVNTMVHHWGPDFIVRPRSGVVVAEGGAYEENYYSLQPPKSIEMNPTTYLNGRGACAKYLSGLICLPGSHCEVGGSVYLNAEGSSAELVARAVNHGGTVVQKGMLAGADAVRAHVDCSGLMLSDTGVIEAVPGLRALHPDARMSHEAAIGRIDRDAVDYLRSKGLDEASAVALIVRGFINPGRDAAGLPLALEQAIREIVVLSGHG